MQGVPECTSPPNKRGGTECLRRRMPTALRSSLRLVVVGMRSPLKRVIERSTAAIPHALAALTVACLLASQAGGARSAAEQTIDLSAYQLTFDENFDRIDVSPWGPDTRWIAHTPWHGDFGDAEFTNPSPTFPFVVENGILRIEARKGSDGKWRSGLLSSNDPDGKGFAQRFGYFEMRAKLPPGPGVWPAFWLVGDGDPSSRIEIDVLEYYGIKPDRYFSTVHVWKKPEMEDNEAFQMEHGVPRGSLTSDFHTYGVSVEPDWIIFYHDRSEIGRTQTPKELRGPFFMLLNLALGSGYPIDEVVSPVHMYVDYVRAYSKK